MQRTLSIIKPDAVKRNHIGDILGMVEKAGLIIVGMKMVALTAERAGEFYHVHKGKSFYANLVEYMSSGNCVAVALEGDEAISRLREICGATDPAEATRGTIRASYGISITMNSIHASDSPASATDELDFFFPDLA